MADGWIKLHRKLCDHWLWKHKPFAKAQAFIDLLLLANFKDKKFLLGGEIINAECGTVVTSTVKLSERWGWSRTKVISFLKMLQSEEMITINSDNKKTVVNIVNFEIYQDFQNDTEQQKISKKSAEKHQKSTNKNVKNEKNGKDTSPPTPSKGAGDGFDEFWKAYPKKVAKAQAQKAWNKIKPNAELQQVILNTLERQKQSVQWQKDNGQFIPYPATWLNGRRWEDMHEQVLQPAQPKYEYNPDDPYANWD